MDDVLNIVGTSCADAEAGFHIIIIHFELYFDSRTRLKLKSLHRKLWQMQLLILAKQQQILFKQLLM